MASWWSCGAAATPTSRRQCWSCCCCCCCFFFSCWGSSSCRSPGFTRSSCCLGFEFGFGWKCSNRGNRVQNAANQHWKMQESLPVFGFLALVLLLSFLFPPFMLFGELSCWVSASCPVIFRWIFRCRAAESARSEPKLRLKRRWSCKIGYFRGGVLKYWSKVFPNTQLRRIQFAGVLCAKAKRRRAVSGATFAWFLLLLLLLLLLCSTTTVIVSLLCWCWGSLSPSQVFPSLSLSLAKNRIKTNAVRRIIGFRYFSSRQSCIFLHFLLILIKAHRANHTHAHETHALRFFKLHTKFFLLAVLFLRFIPLESPDNWRFSNRFSLGSLFYWIFTETRRSRTQRDLRFCCNTHHLRARGNCIYGLCIYAARAIRPLGSVFRERIFLFRYFTFMRPKIRISRLQCDRKLEFPESERY